MAARHQTRRATSGLLSLLASYELADLVLAEEDTSEDACEFVWSFPLPLLYGFYALGAYFAAGIAVKAVFFNVLLSKHRDHGQTVDGHCLKKWTDVVYSTSTDSEGHTTTSSTTYYYFSVRYAVQMATPSASGAQYYRVTKSFEKVSKSLYNKVSEGPTQMNHIMSVTNDARSAIVQKSVDKDTPAKIAIWALLKFTVVLALSGSPFILVFKILNLNLAACELFWIILVATFAMFVIGFAFHARYAAAKAPTGVCEEVPTADLDVQGYLASQQQQRVLSGAGWAPVIPPGTAAIPPGGRAIDTTGDGVADSIVMPIGQVPGTATAEVVPAVPVEAVAEVVPGKTSPPGP